MLTMLFPSIHDWWLSPELYLRRPPAANGKCPLNSSPAAVDPYLTLHGSQKNGGWTAFCNARPAKESRSTSSSITKSRTTLLPSAPVMRRLRSALCTRTCMCSGRPLTSEPVLSSGLT